jgi:tRNA(Arg) A34 adenosine deaminase TadA
MVRNVELDKAIKMRDEFLSEAIRLSLEAVRNGIGGPFGAVIVKDNEIIGRGCNQVTSAKDPTAHAEIVAIREACQRLGSFHLNGCELYSSCEPCPMCLAAIYWARIDRVFYALSKRHAAEIGFADEFIAQELSKSSARKLPMIQIMKPEALVAFNEWQHRKDRIVY